MRALQPIRPISSPQLLRAALYVLGLDLDGRAVRRAARATAADLLRRARRDS